MKEFNRQKLAHHATHLTGGHSKTACAVSAVSFLLIVLFIGMLLAWRAHRFEPDEGTLLSELFKAEQGAKVTQTLTDPENMALLFAYLDAMGETVTNLQLSHRWSLLQFTALVQAAEDAQAQLQSFSWSPGGDVFQVHCTGEAALAQRMITFLENSGAFDGAVISSTTGESEKEYTIECRFT